MINIRDAQIKDAEELTLAEKEIAKNPGFFVSRPHELKVETFRKTIAHLLEISNGKYIVAEKDGFIIGQARLDPMGLEAIEHVVRLSIGVHPGHEEKGIGEMMLSHLIEWAKIAPKVEKIELHVRAENTRAIRLYQKLGFMPEGRLRERVHIKSDKYIDDIEMSLFVKKPRPAPTVVNLAIGKVVSTRKEAVDDDWDKVQSFVQLDEAQFTSEALRGLDLFSHVEIFFYMDQVDIRKIEKTSRRPRNNTNWPQVGVFAQRGKNRPNQLGSTICRILKIDGLNLYVEGLDAVDGTPILDIKPWVKEFGPRGEVKQPEWMSELMKSYWKKE